MVLGECHGLISLFYWFQGLNLLVDDQKEGGLNIKVEFLFCYQSESMSYFAPFIPVFPDTALKERCLG